MHSLISRLQQWLYQTRWGHSATRSPELQLALGSMVVALVLLLVGIGLFRLEMLLSSLWQVLFSCGWLLGGVIAFTLLWAAPPAQWGRAYPVLNVSIILLPFIASLMIILPLERLFGLATYTTNSSAIILALGSGLVIGGLLELLLRLKWRFQEQSLPPEVKAALEQTKDGWGTPPQQARKRGLLIIGTGLGFGVLGIAMGVASGSSFLSTDSPEGLVGEITFFSMSLLMLLGGLAILLVLPHAGWRLMHFWRQGRSNPPVLHVLQGQVVGMWIAGKGDGAQLLIKVQPPIGVSKVFLVGPHFVDLLPDNAQEVVRIEYLSGSEALMSVDPLVKERAEEESSDSLKSEESPEEG